MTLPVSELFGLVNGGCCDDDVLADCAAAIAWLRTNGVRVSGEAGFETLIATRDALRCVFEAFRDGAAPPAHALRSVERALDAAPLRHRVVVDGARVVMRREREVETLGHVAALVADAAASLFERADPARLRSCAGCDCFYYDESKNRSRTWCDMRRCGNRAKVAAFAARAHA